MLSQCPLLGLPFSIDPFRVLWEYLLSSIRFYLPLKASLMMTPSLYPHGVYYAVFSVTACRPLSLTVHVTLSCSFALPLLPADCHLFAGRVLSIVTRMS